MRRLYLNDRFKLFLATKPPLVTFLVCLVSFIFVMISFRVYIDYTEQIANPDEADWNVFTKSLSKLDFCISMPVAMGEEEKNQKPEGGQSSDTIVQFEPNVALANFSYNLDLDMEFYGNMSELKQISVLSGKIDSFLLGLKKNNLIFNMSVNEVSLNQNEDCNRNLLLKQTCSHYIISGCVTLTSTLDMFPRTIPPRKCKVPRGIAKKQIETSHQAHFLAYKETPEFTHQYWCPSLTKAKINYKKDPNLNAYLTQIDRHLIKENLTKITIGLVVTVLVFLLNGIYQIELKNTSYFPVIEVKNRNYFF